MNRIKFFTVHLLASLFIALVLSSIVYFVWYPEPLILAIGVLPLCVLIFFVDIILGPLCTLLVYKPQKKSLKFDLAVIISVQILALSYGVYALAQGRPIAIVYDTYYFEAVKKTDAVISASGQYEPSWLGPEYFAVDRQAVRTRGITAVSGAPLTRTTSAYKPLKSADIDLSKMSLELSLLKNFNDINEVDRILKAYPDAEKWLPLKAAQQDMVVLMNKQNEVIKVVDLRPWNS